MADATIILSETPNSNVVKIGGVITGSSSRVTATVESYNEGTKTLTINYINCNEIFDVSNDTLTASPGATVISGISSIS